MKRTTCLCDDVLTDDAADLCRDYLVYRASSRWVSQTLLDDGENLSDQDSSGTFQNSIVMWCVVKGGRDH